MPLFVHHFRAMGGPCELQVDARDEADAAGWMKIGEDEVRRIEFTYSRYRPDSQLSRINAAAGRDWIDCDAEMHQLLELAGRLHQITGGLFDATSGILRRVWRFDGSRPVPTDDELQPLLDLIGWSGVLRRGDAVMLERPGMELDFGGIGKEYATDRVAALWQAQGVRHGLINLAGDLRVLGGRPDGQPWKLGIQHPRQPQQLLAELALRDGALATSGDYERCLIDAQGRRHGHILHPGTGRPAYGWQSVSVVAPLAVAAGGLSTAAMLMGDQALPWLRQQGVDFLAVDQDGTVQASAP